MYESLQMCLIQARVQHSVSQGKDTKSLQNRLKPLSFSRSSAQHRSGFEMGINGTGQLLYQQWHHTAFPNSLVPRSLAPSRGCPSVLSCTGCNQVSWAQVGLARPHSAGAKKRFQVRMTVVCLPPAFASKPMLPQLPKHVLTFV